MSLVLISMLLLSKKSVSPFPTGPSRHHGIDLYQVDSNRLGEPKSAFRSAVPVASRLWPGGEVPYRMSSSLDSLKPDILTAIQKIQAQTCVRFVDALPTHTDHINITLKEGCWSDVGRISGGQDLSLSLPCGESQGIILHELLHALGLWHEHARSDRDEYIDVLERNIQEGEMRNFVKLLPWENNLLDEPFDFNSVMLYGSMAFSKDGVSPTLVSRVKGQRLVDLADKPDLSAIDVRKINKLYECTGHQRPTPIDVPDMQCPFEIDLCHFINQESETLTNWELKDGSVILSRTESKTSPLVFGRMFSPYLKSYHRDEGCLSFRFQFKGSALKGIRIYSQPELEEKQLLAELSTEDYESDMWDSISQPVSLGGDFRLVFEGAFQFHSGIDTIMLDDLQFTWKPCS